MVHKICRLWKDQGKTDLVRDTSGEMRADSKVILEKGLAGNLGGKPLEVSCGIQSA